MGMEMINTIIFDVGEVYLTGLLEVERRLGELLGVDAETVHEKIRGKDLEALFHGKIKEETYLNRVIRKNGWKINPQTLKRITQENLAEIKGTREIIERLKKEGFRIGLMAVHSREWTDFCRDKSRHRKLFNSRSYSFEVGVTNSSRKEYKIILEKLNAEPQDCLFIDDNLRDLESAGAVGIGTVLFTTPKHLEEDLINMSLLAQKPLPRTKHSIRQYLRTPSLS